MAFDGDFVWASSGPHVLKYSRGKEVCAFRVLTAHYVHLPGRFVG